jgi:hypothetical protein
MLHTPFYLKSVSISKLGEIIASLPREAIVFPNSVGNMTVFSGTCAVPNCTGDCMGQYIGFIDFAKETYVSVRGEDV